MGITVSAMAMVMAMAISFCFFCAGTPTPLSLSFQDDGYDDQRDGGFYFFFRTGTQLPYHFLFVIVTTSLGILDITQFI